MLFHNSALRGSRLPYLRPFVAACLVGGMLLLSFAVRPQQTPELPQGAQIIAASESSVAHRRMEATGLLAGARPIAPVLPQTCVTWLDSHTLSFCRTPSGAYETGTASWQVIDLASGRRGLSRVMPPENPGDAINYNLDGMSPVTVPPAIRFAMRGSSIFTLRGDEQLWLYRQAMAEHTYHGPRADDNDEVVCISRPDGSDLRPLGTISVSPGAEDPQVQLAPGGRFVSVVYGGVLYATPTGL